MAKTANELLEELQKISFRLTSGDIPLTIDGKKVMVHPELRGFCGENGNYWCELNIKEAEL